MKGFHPKRQVFFVYEEVIREEARQFTDVPDCDDGGAGGGGGYYGGGSGWVNGSSAGGGSGYIGNSLLSSKVMYCYNCGQSSKENTKTVSTTCNEETPTENCAKKGTGYAKITYIEEN